MPAPAATSTARAAGRIRTSPLLEGEAAVLGGGHDEIAPPPHVVGHHDLHPLLPARCRNTCACPCSDSVALPLSQRVEIACAESRSKSGLSGGMWETTTACSGSGGCASAAASHRGPAPAIEPVLARVAVEEDDAKTTVREREFTGPNISSYMMRPVPSRSWILTTTKYGTRSSLKIRFTTSNSSARPRCVKSPTWTTNARSSRAFSAYRLLRVREQALRVTDHWRAQRR